MKRTLQSIALMALAVLLALLPTRVLAEGEKDAGQHSAGNLFVLDGGAVGQAVESDLYGFGENVDASLTQVGESAILAGRNVTVNNSDIGGSLRAAGYQVSVNGTTVAVNATLAGYSLTMGQDFFARGVYGAANTILFDGQCQELTLCAKDVTILGKVEGNARVYAQNVVIGPDAQIAGVLYVTAAAAPSVPSSAMVGSVSFTQAQSDRAEDAAAVVKAVSPIMSALKKLAMMLPGRILLAVAYFFILRKSVDSASEMLSSRPAVLPLTGLVSLICIPIAALILVFTYIGVPPGLLIICLYALTLAFSVSFAGCIAGRLAFPKLHPLLAYIIGVSALTALKLIPFLGGLLTFACMLCVLGYFVQRIYQTFGKKAVRVE